MMKFDALSHLVWLTVNVGLDNGATYAQLKHAFRPEVLRAVIEMRNKRRI